MTPPGRGTSPALREAGRALGNAAARVRDALVAALPGPRPRWAVLELTGRYPERRPPRRLLSLEALASGRRETSLAELAETVDALCRSPSLEGVVLRVHELSVDLAAAYALRRLVARLRGAGKRTVAVAPALDMAGYLVVSAAHEVVVPESAELWVHGSALGATFVADALGRAGIRFEKLAIREYKNAGDELALPAMSEAQRRQYEAVLDGVERYYLGAVGAGRGRPPDEVRRWIEEGVTSAGRALELGMVDRVAYEDEVVGAGYVPAERAAALAPSRPRPPGGRVAVVSLEGTIVTGRSRRSPVPLPIFGGTMAGSETLVRALRAAARDPHTEAVVLHVDSGGGSALASDLIWREVRRIAERMPLVAVMGRLAASGGYYVLAAATRVVASPATLTGSIGVVAGKLVLEEFNERHGLNPEVLRRGRFATLMRTSRGWDDDERGLMERYIAEVYDRFVSRVAAGRRLSRERVDEIGRGRIWTGLDALEVGLVDELGDVRHAIALAKELAGLHEDADVWDVHAPARLVLPAGEGPAEALASVAPLLAERALLVPDVSLRLR
jgi:protease-4